MPDQRAIYLDENLMQQLKAEIASAETIGCLTAKQLSIIDSEGWFKLFFPKTQGGPGFSFLEALQLEEVIAAIDGSLGWTVTLCAGAGWFTGFLPPAIVAKLHETPNVCLGGSGKIGGTAIQMDNDYYQISGAWPYATGAAHATHFTFNCSILDQKGNPIMVNGRPMIRSCFIEATKVNTIPTWSSIGMIATGSFGFTIDKQLVPSSHFFTQDLKDIYHSDPIYRVPFSDFAALTLAVNMAGMANAFHEACTEKNNTSLQLYTAFNNLRSDFYEVVQQVEIDLQKAFTLPESLSTSIANSSSALVEKGLALVNYLFPRQGMSIIKTNHPANRIWRNLHTASVHQQFNNG